VLPALRTGLVALFQEDDHRCSGVLTIRSPATSRLFNSPRMVTMSSHNVRMWVTPTLVTAGLSFSGGATCAAGYPISSMTRSSLRKPTMAVCMTTGDGTSSPPVALELLPPCDTGREHREPEDVGLPAGGSFDIGDADGRVGESGERGGSGPAGDLVLEPLVQASELHPATPVELAQHNDANEHQGRDESRERAESDDSGPVGVAPFLFHIHSRTPRNPCAPVHFALGIGRWAGPDERY
jgi:hypothetical protein